MPVLLNLQTEILQELQSLSEELMDLISTSKHLETSSMPTLRISTKRGDLTQRHIVHFGLGTLGIAIAVKRHVASRSQVTVKVHQLSQLLVGHAILSERQKEDRPRKPQEHNL